MQPGSFHEPGLRRGSECEHADLPTRWTRRTGDGQRNRASPFACAPLKVSAKALQLPVRPLSRENTRCRTSGICRSVEQLLYRLASSGTDLLDSSAGDQRKAI